MMQLEMEVSGITNSEDPSMKLLGIIISVLLAEQRDSLETF